jgi:hypothetical protein
VEDVQRAGFDLPAEHGLVELADASGSVDGKSTKIKVLG